MRKVTGSMPGAIRNAGQARLQGSEKTDAVSGYLDRNKQRQKLYIKNPIESRIWIFRKTENSKPDLRNGNSAGCSIT